MGDANQAARVTVEWSSGLVRYFSNVASDQILTYWEPPALQAMTLASQYVGGAAVGMTCRYYRMVGE